MKIKCPKCKYEWDCNSKLIFVTCPSCRLKIERPKKDEMEWDDDKGKLKGELKKNE